MYLRPSESSWEGAANRLMRALALAPMAVEDLDEVLDIERLSFKTPWSRAAFRYEISRTGWPAAWSSASRDKLVGYLSACGRSAARSTSPIWPCIRTGAGGARAEPDPTASWRRPRPRRHARLPGGASPDQYGGPRLYEPGLQRDRPAEGTTDTGEDASSWRPVWPDPAPEGDA